jgi:hypothetical protein
MWMRVPTTGRQNDRFAVQIDSFRTDTERHTA